MSEDLKYIEGRKFKVKLIKNFDGRVRAAPSFFCPDLPGEQLLARATEIFQSLNEAKAVLEKRAEDLGYPKEAIDIGGS